MKNWQRLKTDPAFKANMEKRSATIAAMREFFVRDGFLEVETPTVVPVPGMEPHLDPFRTEVRALDGRKYGAHLITSPEYAMKKLLAGGLTKIFEFARAYRNGEPWDGTHNPEFTMLEWYRADADYSAIMSDMERMVAETAVAVTGSTKISYQGREVELAAPWVRMSVAEAFVKYTGIDLGAGIDDPAKFRADVESRGVTLTPDDSWDDAFFKIFLRDIEPKLGAQLGGADSPPERLNERIMPGTTALSGGLSDHPARHSEGSAARTPARPVILYDYPRSMAALARIKADDTRYAERFEVYVCGIELGNAFSELNDAAEQRRRLAEEQAERRRLGASEYGLDEQFLEAVGQMPPSAGIAFGVDRLVMLLADAAKIRDVMYFPASDLFE